MRLKVRCAVFGHRKACFLVQKYVIPIEACPHYWPPFWFLSHPRLRIALVRSAIF